MTRTPSGVMRARRGSAAIETAVVMASFLAVLFGAFDMARLIAWQHVLDQAVLKAARYAAVNSSTASAASIMAAAVTAATPELGSSLAGTLAVTVAFNPSLAVGNTVTISASLAWAPISILTQFTSVTLTSSATLTVLN